MVQMKVLFQGLKKLVKDGGHAYESEHRAILLTPPACGRWVHSLTLHRGLPLLPLLSSPLPNVLLQESVNLRIIKKWLMCCQCALTGQPNTSGRLDAV